MTFGGFIILLLGFLFSALFSGIETGSYMLNRIRLRRRERERRRGALMLARLLENPYLFIFTVLIGNNIAVFAVSKQVTDLYLATGLQAGGLLFGFMPWNAEVAATLTLMFPLFLFAEVGPKNLFRKRADTLMYRFSGLIRVLVVLFLPFTWPLRQLFRLMTHGLENASVRDFHRLSPDALREYFSTSEKEGIITSHQNRMLDNVTAMHRIPVRMLMTPFKKVPQLQEGATVADFKRLTARRGEPFALLMHKHQVVGMVSVFHIVQRRLDDREPLRPYAEVVLRLEQSRNLKSSFYRLRRHPRHCAVIVDVRRHPVGFIRLEDVASYIAKRQD